MASMTLHARSGRKKWRDALAASAVLKLPLDLVIE